MQLPIPLPNDPNLAGFILERYAASHEARMQMEPPPLRKTRDGILTALHFYYQNNPIVFIGGWLITIAAVIHAVFRLGAWLTG